MLVLSRKLGESIVIGAGEDAATVSIQAISAVKVRLGVEAPKRIPVWRTELLKASEPPPGAEERTAALQAVAHKIALCLTLAGAMLSDPEVFDRTRKLALFDTQPDRGGAQDTFCQVQAAVAVLKAHHGIGG